MKLIIGIVIGVIVLLVGGSLLSGMLQKTDADVVSQKGLHWHPHLTITVKGEQVPVAANIGIGAVHQPIHTHDESGTIHVEFGGLVRKQDLRLGQLFKNWGKEFNSFGSNVTMTVNGQPNTELENYEMKDGDKIEVRYQ